MAIRGAPHSPKLQHCWNLTMRLFSVISRTLVGVCGGVLPPCREAVGVFYSPSRLGEKVNKGPTSGSDRSSPRGKYAYCILSLWGLMLQSYDITLFSYFLKSILLYPLQRIKTPPKRVSWVWHLTSCGDEAPVIQILVLEEYLFVCIIPRSTQTWNTSTFIGWYAFKQKKSN